MQISWTSRISLLMKVWEDVCAHLRLKMCLGCKYNYYTVVENVPN